MYLVYTVNDPRGGAAPGRVANVLIADPRGNRKEVLFRYHGFIFHLVPSPKGDKIAFVGSGLRFDKREARDVFLYDIKSNRYSNISEAGNFSRAVKGAPIFTPDGKILLFLSQSMIGEGQFNVFKYELESGKLGGLYTDPLEDIPLTLMPDGKHCVAVRRIPEAFSSFEYLSINIATGQAKSIYRFDYVTKVGPAFFDPSSSTIYCDRKPIDPGSILTVGIRSRETVAIDLESGKEKVLFDPSKVTYVYQIFTAKDGDSWLLLRRQEEIESEETPMSRICIARIDGSDFKYLTGTEARSYLLPPPSNIPPISPDNSLLFFYRQDPIFLNEDIWVMEPDGKNPVNISNTAGYPEGSAGWIVIPSDDLH